MTGSVRRIYAIFEKDFKDLSKNLYVLSSLLIPVLLAFLMRTAEGVQDMVYYMIINLTFAAVGTFLQSAMIAEEKEKNTLRGLMLSPASTTEILVGKSLLTASMTFLLLLLSLRILGKGLTFDGMWMTAFLLLFLFYIAFGTVIGLLSRSLMEASVFIVPVLLIFGMGSMFQAWMDKYEFLGFLQYFPNFLMEKAGAADGSWQSVSLLALWALAAVFMTVVVYQRSTRDD
ncbi:ABC transporter permease [Halobacillus sp. ACCC02827]|uniref:ABC transporter permease n=1 Tax=Halobacillus sp. ACCC02827 TaxID=3052090 RepID=UPI00256FBCAF|nr:ABC transporter permease [Halobacillus sp. ACCC02827]WJE17267.1 ABC transporter permease [Halobacillus sp. ACCC02827]